MSLFKDEDSPWVPITEFAKIFDFQKKTLTRYINSGKIKTFRIDNDGDKYQLHIIHTYNELKVIAPNRVRLVQEEKAEKAAKTAAKTVKKEELKPIVAPVDSAKAENTRIKNELLRMELEERRNNLISREAVDAIETEYLSRLKSIIQQTPSQMARLTGIDEKLFEDIISSALEQFNGPLDAKKKMYQNLTIKNSSKSY